MPEFSKPKYADLILPLALTQLYTYRIPQTLVASLKVGQRVIVQFGKTKMYTALVYEVHDRAPEHYEAKELLEALDQIPVVSEMQLKLWDWISEYYLCSLGEIFTAALPSIMKLQSESIVRLNPETDIEGILLTPEEQRLIDKLQHEESLSIGDASKLTGLKNGLRLIRDMIERNILAVQEEMSDAFHPRQVSYVRMTEKGNDEEFMRELFSKLEKKAPKQLHLLMSFIQMKQEKERNFFAKTQFLRQSGGSVQALQQLISKGVFELFEDEESLSVSPALETGFQVELSEVQQGAY